MKHRYQSFTRIGRQFQSLERQVYADWTSVSFPLCQRSCQPRSQGLRGETVTKTLVKFVLSFQNFGEKIACAVRHNRIQPLLQYRCVALRMRLFSQNFGTIKRILPGSSSPSHREGPGTEVEELLALYGEQWRIMTNTLTNTMTNTYVVIFCRFQFLV